MGSDSWRTVEIWTIIVELESSSDLWERVKARMLCSNHMFIAEFDRVSGARGCSDKVDGWDGMLKCGCCEGGWGMGASSVSWL